MSDENTISKIEFAMKMISTYGVSVIFATALLGYFLYKDYTLGKTQTEALNNNTAAMQAIDTSVKQLSATILERSKDVE